MNTMFPDLEGFAQANAASAPLPYEVDDDERHEDENEEGDEHEDEESHEEPSMP
jgi:hypothetical protein